MPGRDSAATLSFFVGSAPPRRPGTGGSSVPGPGRRRVVAR